jgi:hypothetical protein
MCDDSSKILFAWAKHAKPTELPDGVGFALHPDEYLVLQVGRLLWPPCLTLTLQVHYAKPQTRDHSGIAITVEQTPPTYTAGAHHALLLWLDEIHSVCHTLRAVQWKIHVLIEKNCSLLVLTLDPRDVPPAPLQPQHPARNPSGRRGRQLQGQDQVESTAQRICNNMPHYRSPIHVFAYRTHAHSLGSVISGYRSEEASGHSRQLGAGIPPGTPRGSGSWWLRGTPIGPR